MAEGDRTEAPTPRRRQQAREQGDIWQPRELGPAVALAVAAAALALAGPWLWRDLAGFLALGLALAGEGDAASLVALARRVPLAVPVALALAVALLGTALALATARRVSLAALAPKLSRLDPLKGLAKLFSPSAAVGAVTAILKLAAVAALAQFVALPLLPGLVEAGEGAGGLAGVGGAVARLAMAGALLLAAIAAIDAGASFLIRENRLKMTRDEVRRESRQNDGAPEIKAAIRRAQFAAASRRMQGALKDAAVVVVNPLHFAVAMRYDAGSDAAPVVVEKGRLEIAAAIVTAARALDIPVIRSPRLARALFFTARRGEPVREELFAAVATILAFVMSFDAPETEAPPPVSVPPDFDFDETGARRRPGAF